ncbi:hypothetical protein BT96DRAFT_795222, partial [Gymnopus androsaceus JB14]
YRPALSLNSTLQEIRVQEAWDNQDAVTVQVVMNCLLKEARGILPPPLDPSTGMPTTARNIDLALWGQYCSHCQSMGLAILEAKLHTTHIEGDKIPEWIVKWKLIVGRLQAAGYPIFWSTILSTFTQLLP